MTDITMNRDDLLVLCQDCASLIGGACAGPDMEWRVAHPGERCGADDCDDSEEGAA